MSVSTLYSTLLGTHAALDLPTKGNYKHHGMPREADLSLNERAFALQALREGIRLDGRPFDAYRELDVTFGEEYGVVDVRLGKTRYVKGAKHLFTETDNKTFSCVESSSASPPKSLHPFPIASSKGFSPYLQSSHP